MQNGRREAKQAVGETTLSKGSGRREVKGRKKTERLWIGLKKRENDGISRAHSGTVRKMSRSESEQHGVGVTKLTVKESMSGERHCMCVCVQPTCL